MTKIFISRPNKIASSFEKAYLKFNQYLKRSKFQPCRLGAGNYTLDAPLIAVIKLIKQCKGVIVLGYPQVEFSSKLSKSDSILNNITYHMPTPWNQIEAALGYSENKPVLIVGHKGVAGGVFDKGVTGEYVLSADLNKIDWFQQAEFKGIFQEWKSRL